MTGQEFRIGVVRGSDRGGDWSVSVVRNWFDSDTVFDDTFVDSFFNPPVVLGSTFTIDRIKMTGIKYEKFTPFVTIRDRVQIGLTYGGGIGALSGTVTERAVVISDIQFDPTTGQQSAATTETVTLSDATEFYALDFVPIGSVEVAAAFILAPDLKARVSGGFNFPNTQLFSVTVNYLFGATN